MSDPQPISPLPAKVVRIVDVNVNRATEGLRVVEEHLRFGLQDPELSKHCKSIRHEVSKTVEAWVAFEVRAACRSTDTDVGTHVQTATEYVRGSTRSIVVANIKRAAESLRVLEEYGKLLSAEFAKRWEALRYETYTLEKSLGHLFRAEDLLSQARLYVLIDASWGLNNEFWTRCDQLLASEVDVLQLRAKHTADRVLVDVACQLSRRCRDAGKLFVVNDRADIASVSAADGLHVGQEELTVAQARPIVGPETIIGVSTHSLEQAQRAIRDGADYIGVGPVFPSATKSFDAYVGPELLRDVAKHTSLPFFAIGGIDETNLATVIAAGATRVAVSRAIWHTDDPVAAALRMKTALRREAGGELGQDGA